MSPNSSLESRRSASAAHSNLERIVEMNADWPADADGDVFRKLVARRFDFSRPHAVDYNVDFERWPPHPDAIAALRKMYGDVAVFEPSEDMNGYAHFQVFGQLSYEAVISIQRRTSEAMATFGGVCESWGVMQDAS